MDSLRTSPPHVQYCDPPTDDDRRWWSAQNESWDDPDGPPALHPLITLRGRRQRFEFDMRDAYDPDEPDYLEARI